MDKVYDENYIKDVLGSKPYAEALEDVRRSVSHSGNTKIEELDETTLKSLIKNRLDNMPITNEVNADTKGLVNWFYHDMAGYSFITRDKLFELDGFEELDINAWNDVDIVLNGKAYKTDYSFLSPKHAIDVHQRMLRVTGTTLDDATPTAVADIGKSMRIAVVKTPIVDEDVAISSSIRKVSTTIIDRDALISNGSLSADMLDFLLLALSRGVSICVSGDTGAGKTVLSGFILSEVAKNKRTITIEQGSREWDFVIKDQSGNPTNSVLHWKTRPNAENEKLNISQEKLVELILRFNADVTGVGEMRGAEAFAVLEAGNTGNTVITTIHSDNTESSPMRIVTLAKKAHPFDDDTLLFMASKAFPILVHMEKLEDDSRRVTEITEMIGYHNHQLEFRRLYSFVIKDNIKENGKTVVVGAFKQENHISKKLAQKLLKKGASKSELKPFVGSDFEWF